MIRTTPPAAALGLTALRALLAGKSLPISECLAPARKGRTTQKPGASAGTPERRVGTPDFWTLDVVGAQRTM